MVGPSTGSGSSRAESRDDRRSRFAESIPPLLASISLWLSTGTVAVIGGDAHRVAALPSLWILIGFATAAVIAAKVAKLSLSQSSPLLVTLLVWLPFFPGTVPASFLIWQGPAEAFVWLVALIGVAVGRSWKLPAIVGDSTHAPWVAGAIVAVGAFLVFSQVRDVIPGGDEPHYLAATQSVIEDFDLRVANNYANGDYLDYFPGRLEPHFLKRSTSGEIYSIHAPGVSFAVLPAFAVAGYAGAVVTMVVIAALTAAITWRLAWRVSGSAGGAWAGVAAVFATAPYFFQTFTIYPEVIGSLCVVCGAWLLIEVADDRDVSPRALVGAGAMLALLPWLHSRFAIIAAALGLVIVVRLAARRSPVGAIAAFLCVPAIAGAAWFAFFWVIWGSPSPTAPYGADTSTSASYIPRGLIGLLFDQQFGLLTTAPIYLIAIAGLVALARQRPRLAIELLLITVPYAIAVASYAMWWAGSAAPVRLFVSILPLAALPVAVLVSRTPGTKRGWPVLTLLLLIVSVGLIVPRAFVESGRFIYNNRAPLDATLEWLSQTVDLPLALPSVHRDGGLMAIRDAAVWLALLVGVTALLGRLGKRSVSVRWAAGSLAIGIAVMIGSSTVWSIRGAPGLTPERSKLAAAGALRPWHRELVDISSARPVDEAAFLDALSIDLPMRTWRVNRVPAGEFTVTPNASLSGPVMMSVGRPDPFIESLQADDLRDQRSNFRLRLPAKVQSLYFTTNGVIPENAPWARLTPVSVRAPVTARNAIRATRYGHARAFFFDEQAYPERDGFWTRANGDATVVIDTDDGSRLSGLPITITAGAVATDVTLMVGDWEQTVDLDAGQKQDVTLPPPLDGAWALTVRSGKGFRPSEREPGNRDVRSLAAWIAIR